MPTPPVRRADSAFTLPELVVVVAALGILALVLGPPARRLLEEHRVSRARSEVEALAKTVAGTSEGTGGWSEAAAGAAHVGPLGGLDHPAADPWGTPYVVSRRPLPGRADGRGPRYEIIVLSAGPDGTWSTPLREGATGPIGGDDIAHVLRTGG